MDYKEPTQDSFKQYLNTLSLNLGSVFNTLVLKARSAVYELVIRPFAYLAAWLQTNLDSSLKAYTYTYLKESTATDSEGADLIASNYFLERRQGSKASGYITAYLTEPMLVIPENTVFTIESYNFKTTKTLIVAESVYEDTDTTTYLPALVTVDNTYMAFIPVEAETSDSIDLNEESTIDTLFSAYNLTGLKLTSAITGGTSTETDSELLERVKTSTTSQSISGSRKALKRLIQELVPQVKDVTILSAEQPASIRARVNNINVNIGSSLDCYIKTSTQPSTKIITFNQTYTESKADHIITITDSDVQGLYVAELLSLNNTVPRTYTVDYGTDVDALSSKQKVQIKVSTTEAVTTINAVIKVSYMSAVYLSQSYLDLDTNKYIGLDCRVKAAVPLILRVDCAVKSSVSLDAETIKGLKACMSTFVNSTQIGCAVLNFSDIQESIKRLYPDIELRLPCAITATLFLKDRTKGSFYSTSGILDISKLSAYNYWDPSCVFFSLIPENINLTIL